MRSSAIIAAALSATAHAAAIGDKTAFTKREASPWCLFPGEGCWKRDATTNLAAKREADPWCLSQGDGCWKREAAASPEPTADPFCLFPGEGCWKEKREAAPAPAPAADPEADPWCLFPGEGCWKEKREAAPEPWCLFPGEGCWKVKRAAYAFANAIRGAEAVGQSRAAEVSNMEGGAAYNAKRALDHIATMIAGRTTDPAEFVKRLHFVARFGPDANLTTAIAATAPEQRRSADESSSSSSSDAARRACLFNGEGCWKRDAAPWCLFPGEGCWKRAEPMSKREAEAEPWCLFPGEGCWKRSDETTPTTTTTTAEAAFFPFEGDEAGAVGYASERDFVAADKRACNQPGEACDVARRAAEALVAEIESSHVQPEIRTKDVEARWCLFPGEGCWKRDNMDEVVARCNAEDGACSQARRDLAAMHTAARNLLEYINEE